MSTYPQRVADNILPLSVAGKLTDAFKEWFFTERTEDHGRPTEDCELCNHEKLRYKFEIKNKNTNNKLWVGSSCILKFNVAVFDEGHVLNKSEAEKKLKALMNKMRLDSCIKALKKLAASENNDILENALNYYLKNKCLSPKFAFVVFWRLNANNIDYHPSFFKINLKKDNFKNDLKDMQTNRVHLIWYALSSSQKKMAIKFGHYAPKST